MVQAPTVDIGITVPFFLATSAVLAATALPLPPDVVTDIPLIVACTAVEVNQGDLLLEFVQMLTVDMGNTVPVFLATSVTCRYTMQ